MLKISVPTKIKQRKLVLLSIIWIVNHEGFKVIAFTFPLRSRDASLIKTALVRTRFPNLQAAIIICSKFNTTVVGFTFYEVEAACEQTST